MVTCLFYYAESTAEVQYHRMLYGRKIMNDKMGEMMRSWPTLRYTYQPFLEEMKGLAGGQNSNTVPPECESHALGA